MDSYVEQYPAKQGGVPLHTWTDVQGGKKENCYIIGGAFPFFRLGCQQSTV